MTVALGPILAAVMLLQLGGCASRHPLGVTRGSGASAVERQLAAAPDRIRHAGLETLLADLRRAVDPTPERPLRIYLLDRHAPQADLLAPDLLQIRIGLLRLVHDTDELAFVLAHEIAHRDADDFSRRQRPEWDPVAAELAADLLGARRLAARGRDPAAGGRLLRRLAAETREPGLVSAIAARATALDAAVATLRPPSDSLPAAAVGPAREDEMQRLRALIADYDAAGNTPE